MQYICRVHGFQGAKRLVDEVLTVVVGEILSSDYTVHICFHEFLIQSQSLNTASVSIIAHLDEVDLGESLVISRLLNVKNRNDVLMVEVS
jgi:hypothetical protein